MLETIDAVRQLLFQDRHVAYREIETTLGISGTSIHSILDEQLTVKKILFALDPTQFVNRSKKKKKNQSIRVAHVLRQLVQTRAKVYRS